MVKFSYRARERLLLEDISLPIPEIPLVLLTGVENVSFQCLGGIAAGLFPVPPDQVVPSLDQLLHVFTGTLQIHEGRFPSAASYVGPDPERHLLFSWVWEEIDAQLGRGQGTAAGVLERFGLEQSFLQRKISTLSGGEKMKLALSLAFSRAAGMYVLHGVVPWLDERGRKQLHGELTAAAETGSPVVMLEQEIEQILPLFRHTRYFNGRTLRPFGEYGGEEKKQRFQNAAQCLKSAFSEGGGKTTALQPSGNADTEMMVNSSNSEGEEEEILRFDNVSYKYAEGFGVKDLTFALSPATVYGFVGDNGSGKSTIARITMRLLRPQSGSVKILGRNLDSIPRDGILERVSYVGQFPEQQIALSDVAAYRNRLKKAGNSMGLDLLDAHFSRARSYPVSVLSSLDIKILCLGSTLGRKTRLIILDEPTWGLDREGEIALCELLARTVPDLQSAALMIISHDHRFIETVCSQVFRVDSGRIHLYGPGEALEPYEKRPVLRRYT
jgi:ABC-type multidrug transport system ATPase subunit